MIDKMGKYLIYGNKKASKRFFSAMQKAGVAQFCNKNSPQQLSDSRALMLQAFKIINVKKAATQHSKLFAPQSFSQEVIAKKATLESLYSDLKKVEKTIFYTTIFGDFSDLELRSVQNVYKLHFCYRKSEKALPDSAIPIDATDSYQYAVFIKDHPKDWQTVELKSLAILENQKCTIEDKICDTEQFLLKASSYTIALQDAILQTMDEENLADATAQSDLFFHEKIFITTAWIPHSKLAKVLEITQSCSIEIEEIAISDSDTIPTFLMNSGLAESGEDLVTFYDTPNVADKDPSAFVAWSFMLFGAIICSDAAYGLVYLLTALFLDQMLVKKSAVVKRVLKLSKTLALFAIGWGIVIGSYFGITLQYDNPLRKYSVMQQIADAKIAFYKNENGPTYKKWLLDNPQLEGDLSVADIVRRSDATLCANLNSGTLLELSIIIGILHIALSMLRSFRKTPSYIGWIFVMLGAYCYFPSLIDSHNLLEIFFLPSEYVCDVGKYLLIAGSLLAWGIAIMKGKTVLDKIAEPWSAIQLFSDVLSYLRLYALALGSIVMTQTFNEQFILAFGPLIGSFALVLGHLLNFVLVIAAIVVHGLRLNFLEWYRYSIIGEGSIFKPLTVFFKRR